MNENQILFDNSVKDRGGIYLAESNSDIDEFLKSILNSATEYINSIRKNNSNLPEVSIYYVNDNTINAYAFKCNTEYFIGINIGAVIKLKEQFINIFNNKKIYDNELFKISNRNVYIEELFLFSIYFLVGHEYAHIRYGHCDLIKHLAGNTLEEMTSDCLIDDGIFRQTLEMDADCCAIANLTNQISKYDKYNKIYLNEEIGWCSLACYILFHIFDRSKYKTYENYDFDSLAKSNHPRPGLRQHYIGSNICTVLNFYFEREEVIEISHKMVDYIFKFEEATTGVHNLRNMEMGISYTKIGNEHLERIHNNWEKTRKLLEEYTHDKLAPFEKYEAKFNFID